LPAASLAVTVMIFVPLCSPITLTDQLAVPLAAPLPPRLFDHVTWVAPTLSEAVPPSVIELDEVLYVVFAVGDVMLTVGTVISIIVAALTIDETLPAASFAQAYKILLPELAKV
jgi:hypothetical protein